MRHPRTARDIGRVDGSNNISSVASRFSNRGATPESTTSVLSNDPEGRASEVNAFRHVLWQSAITAKHGENIAEEAGDAHEDNPNADLSIRNFDNLVEADQTVDLLNNQIGREIGANNPNAPTDELAKLTLEEYRTNGFYTATENADGTYTISKTTITQQQYEQLSTRFENLDENGHDR